MSPRRSGARHMDVAGAAAGRPMHEYSGGSELATKSRFHTAQGEPSTAQPTPDPPLNVGNSPENRGAGGVGILRSVVLTIISLAAVSLSACGRGATDQPQGTTAPGAPRTAKTAVLESAANALQSTGPVNKISLYLDGFHAAKDDPAMQMEAHHYCNIVNEEFTQCVLFDGNAADSRLMGIEYIISASLYATLPAGEKAYWHPHNFEILSGQLRLPGVPDIAEKQALAAKMNSYGKTWHTWMTGMHGRASDELPLGPPRLQWSFNHDGEADPDMVSARDARMGFDTARARKDRTELLPLAQPQGGVDAMRARFPGTSQATPGVTDNGDPLARPVPTFGMTEGTPAAGARR